MALEGQAGSARSHREARGAFNDAPMSSLGRNEVPITGGIPGAGRAGEEGLTLGKIETG